MTDPVKDIFRLIDSAAEAAQSDRFAKAARLSEAAAQKAESHFGAYHEKTLEIRDYWADCLLDAQNHPAAIACNEETLQRRLRSASFGRRHESTLAIRRLLADSYLQTKQQAKSIEHYRQVIAIDEETNSLQTLFGDVLTLVCLLADWGCETGDRAKISEAHDTSMKYLRKAETTVPGDHDVLLDFYYNIGIQLRHLGQYQEASQRFEQVLVLVKKVAASGKRLKNDVLPEKARKWLFLCLKKMEEEIAERDGKSMQQEDHLHGLELGIPGPVAPRELDLSTASKRHEGARKVASMPHSQLQSAKSTKHRPRASETTTSPPSRGAAPISHSDSTSTGSSRSKSESTVGNPESNRKTKDSGGGNSSPGETPSAVAERPRSASTVASSHPEGWRWLSMNPQLAPAAAPSPRPVGSRVPPLPTTSSLPEGSRWWSTNPQLAPAAAPSPRPVRSRVPPLPTTSSAPQAAELNNARRNSRPASKGMGKAERQDERPASAGASVVVLPKVSPTRNGGGFFGSDTQNDSERWFVHLRRNAHRFLYKYYVEEMRVRIALLDTGVALRNPSAIEMSQDIQIELGKQVKRGKVLQNDLLPDRDVDGHGSECAYLLTRVSPFAQILSYRIAEKMEDDIEPAIVAEALRDAIHGRQQVDIISMSFGIRPTQDIRNLLNEAKGKGILMFAATSNDGGPRITFPANSDEVFAIDAADRLGGPSPNNPGAFQKPYRLTALGEVLSLRGSMEGSQRQRDMIRGSSFATPVAAATAAVILEFAHQPPLSYDPLALKGLKMLEGMRPVLIQLFSTKKSASSEFNHINIEHFKPMNNKERWNDGGECDDRKSDRYKAANYICEELKKALDDDCGQLMEDRIEANEREKWRKEAEEAWEEIERNKKEELEKVLKDAVDRIYPS